MIYCGYRLLCETCGDKTATWTVDTPDGYNGSKLGKSSLERAKREIAGVAHKDHTYKFITTVTDAKTRTELLVRLEKI